MHVGPWKSLCRVSEVTFTSDGPDVNAIQRHACMLTNHFWQGACRMSGSVKRPPPLFFSFADFKESRKTKTNYQPLLLPHRPTQCCEVFIYMGNTFPSIHQKKDEKAFGNMKDDYGNNSINERVRSMAKLFCDLLVIWGYSNSHKEAG